MEGIGRLGGHGTNINCRRVDNTKVSLGLNLSALLSQALHALILIVVYVPFNLGHSFWSAIALALLFILNLNGNLFVWVMAPGVSLKWGHESLFPRSHR